MTQKYRLNILRYGYLYRVILLVQSTVWKVDSNAIFISTVLWVSNVE